MRLQATICMCAELPSPGGNIIIHKFCEYVKSLSGSLKGFKAETVLQKIKEKLAAGFELKILQQQKT